jgi:hypothetical protein
MTVKVTKIGESFERPGRWRWVKLAGQRVQKQNFLREQLLGTEKGTGWCHVNQIRGMDGLARLKELQFSHFIPTIAGGFSYFRIRGKIEILDLEGLAGHYWEVENHPSLLAEDPAAKREGEFFCDRGASGHVIDEALFLTFPRSRVANRKTLHFGTPLDFSVVGSAEEEMDDFCHFDLFLQATPDIFPRPPRWLELSVGIAYAQLERQKEEVACRATSFKAKVLAEFPSFPLRSIERIKDVDPLKV